MGALIKKDDLTNGVITSMIERSWQCFKDKSEFSVTLEEMKKIHLSLLSFDDGSCFGEVAEQIYIPLNIDKTKDPTEKMVLSLKKFVNNESISPKDENNFIKVFDETGLILFDRMYGSAFGRFNYIYRAKGDRVIWFKSGKIAICNIYSTIDEHGFQLSCSEMSSIELFSDEQYDSLDLDMGVDLNDLKTLLKGVINIKKQYPRDYVLEYLIDPPDVNILSDYSAALKNDIWNSIILLAKNAILNDDIRITEFLMYTTKIMEELEAQPPPSKIIELMEFYIEFKENIDTVKITKILDAFRKTIPSEKSEKEVINYDKMIADLKSITTGTKEAIKYQKFIFNTLIVVFNKYLKRPKSEQQVNEGRKRVDIVFDNIGEKGFFSELKTSYDIISPKIFIECKNYENDIKNPEIDQLIGRFNDRTGKFGLLICRKITNEKLILKRCKDAHDKRIGYIIVLTDVDIIELIQLRAKNDFDGINNFMREKHEKLLYS